MDNTAPIVTRGDTGPSTPLALPPGWRSTGARIEPVKTPRGLLARGGMMRARCDTGECRRRIDMNLDSWIDHGHGDSELDTLIAAYLCGQLRCGLKFDPEYFPRGIPLQHYVGREERIEVLCASCGRLRPMTAEQLIAALLRRGLGTGNTGIVELSTKIRSPCRACGKQNWKTSLRGPSYEDRKRWTG